MTQETGKDKLLSSRRKFLKKTSAGAIITTLPAQSVWGACTVSGALSGGSKEVGECVYIPLSGGRSPGFWRDLTTGSSLADAFPYLKAWHKVHNATRRDCEEAYLINVINQAKNTTIFIGNDPTTGSAISLNIATALTSPGGIAWNLAAVYLNFVFNFHPPISVILPSGYIINTVEKLIQHLYALELRGQLSGFDFGFNDGSTAWEPAIGASGCV